MGMGLPQHSACRRWISIERRWLTAAAADERHRCWAKIQLGPARTELLMRRSRLSGITLGGHRVKHGRRIVSLPDSIQRTEEALIKLLEAKRGIADATGKGNATENLVERELLVPYLPIGFRCLKGAVVASGAPDEQSPAIDRVVYEPGVAPPLRYDEAHSVFPIESVAGVVEITMNLDADKLREDLHRIAPVRAMRRRRFLVPVPNTTTRVGRLEQETLSPRSFIVGLPADSAWKPETIAKALRERQLELGTPNAPSRPICTWHWVLRDGSDRVW